MSNKIYYFSYGSNNYRQRIEDRLGQVEHCGKYTLQGYKLSFNHGNGFESFANLIKDGRCSVEGVIYRLHHWQINLLDSFEGCYNPDDFYHREKQFYKGEFLHFYIADWIGQEFEYPISRYYYRFLVKGALENNLYKTLEILYSISPKNIR